VSAERGEPDTVVYLTPEDALEIYAAIIDATAHEAADHLRSRGALEGALARPETYAHYEQADLALQAAVLAHRIAETQPFVDGDKRAALVAMLTFLEINGQRVKATDPELAGWIVSFSRGTTPQAVAGLIRSHVGTAG
jgi:death-on-curing protein